MALRSVASFLLVALGALAIALGVPAYFRFKRYVDEDPRLCITCHRANPEFAVWLGGSHRRVACQKCHHTTAGQSVAMLRAYVAGASPDGKHAVVEVGACAACHFSHDPNWPQVGGSRGHKLHYEQLKIPCVRCHAASMHGFAPVAEKCAACHPNHAVSLGGMQTLHCFACHEFLTTEPGLRPTRRDCMQCHSAQGINAPVAEHGGPMGMACSACHKPHAAPGEALVPCAACHAAIATAGLHARHADRGCRGCHPPHTWRATEAGCARCHETLPADHPAAKACFACHGFRAAAPAAPAAGAAGTKT